jgi:hypothetical protein
MFFYGSFAMLSPATLLQMLCQEQRSVQLFAWQGTSRCLVRVVGGAIVAARCDELVGVAALFRLLGWSSGQFRLQPTHGATATQPLGRWEELLLEAARQRDEARTPAAAPHPPIQQHELVALLQVCPALDAVAIIGDDGCIHAQVGLPEALARDAGVIVGGLVAVGTSVTRTDEIAVYRKGTYTLLLAPWDQHGWVLALPSSDVPIDEAVSQLACWTTVLH